MEDHGILNDTVSRLLQQHGTRPVIDAAERGAWPDGLWDRLTELGLHAALVDAGTDEPGLEMADAFGIVRLAGAYALPVPLPETMLANRVLAALGLPVTTDPTMLTWSAETVIEKRSGSWTVSGTLHRVPWGRRCRLLVPLRHGPGTVLLVLPRADCELVAGANIAGEPRDTLRFETIVGTPPPEIEDARVSPDGLRAAGAALRCSQMAGAMARIAEMTVAYAQDRVQFGRPIGKFQAVQQSIARLVGEAAAARAAADLAVEGFGHEGAFLGIAAAKARCGEAAGLVASLAHQVHGAMGFAHEYGLQTLTRRLWSWRDEMGNETEWARRLGRHLAAGGGERLWAAVTAV